MTNVLALLLLCAGQGVATDGAIIFKQDVVPVKFTLVADNLPLNVELANLVKSNQVQVKPIPIFDPHPAHRATVVRVHDGDTALFELDLEAGVSVETWIRLEGFNSPELHGPNKDLAAKATQALKDLLDSGEVWVKTTGDMTFARYVGRVYIKKQDGTAFDVSVKMAELGYAVEQGQ